MWGAGGPHRIPSGHNEVCARINELALDRGFTCSDGRLHDVDVVYTARSYVIYAYCMRCMKQLPIGGRRPDESEIHLDNERQSRVDKSRA